MKQGMIKLSVMYPTGEGKTFDMDYYLNKHIPLVGKLLGESNKEIPKQFTVKFNTQF